MDQNKWPSLAQDLAVMMVPESPITDFNQIYTAYEITADELKQILSIPKFQELYEQALNDFKSQGQAAGILYRTRQLSAALAEDLFRQALGRQIEAKDSLKLLELLMKASGLFKDKDQAQVNTQVNVGLTLPLPKGLKKLQHLELADS